MDVTDELVKDGEYTYHKDLGDSSFDVEVTANGIYIYTVTADKLPGAEADG